MLNAKKVYLVGAGPGDPGLLTLKGRDLLAVADCVIYDNLVNPEILRFAADDAELIYAGKRHGSCAMPQEAINATLVIKSREHRIVVRLKGGDPFVFGRGGEEAEALTNAGVEWEVVPGISAGIAAAAYAGIPITHRGLSSSVAFVTGHEDPSKDRSMINWVQLATGVDTLVFFMGVSQIREIAHQLLKHGRSAETPVAVIRWGTYAQQEVYASVLRNIVDLMETNGVKSPAIILVGEVVRLRERLNWFAKVVAEVALNAA
jgi:uroporphyrinogen III methyltransferase/synthase